MLWRIILILLFLALIIWAVHSRLCIKKTRTLEKEATIASPASKALAEIVAIAGGIYLSLILVTSFLKVNMPEKVMVSGNWSLDPIAMTAVVIALLQPVVLKLYYRFFK